MIYPHNKYYNKYNYEDPIHNFIPEGYYDTELSEEHNELLKDIYLN